jgi:hypothetical protein
MSLEDRLACKLAWMQYTPGWTIYTPSKASINLYTIPLWMTTPVPFRRRRTPMLWKA